MKTRKISLANTRVLYFFALMVIVVVFLLLGGGPWVKGIMYGNRMGDFVHWNMTEFLISLGIGILIGIVISRWKW